MAGKHHVWGDAETWYGLSPEFVRKQMHEEIFISLFFHQAFRSFCQQFFDGLESEKKWPAQFS